jgi:tetratricopeptide (TPR) repeat protein
MTTQRPAGRAAAPIALALVTLFVAGGFDLLRSRNRAIGRGNELLKAGQAKEALAEYDRAKAQLPDDPGVRYDRALALVALGQLDEAATELGRASEGHDRGLKALAAFNHGNVLAKQEKWKEAVEAYRRALTADPKLFDAKWNLEIALRKLKEQKEKEQKKQDEEKKKKDEEQKKQDEEQKKKDEEQKQQGQDGGAPQSQPEQQKPEQKQPEQPKDPKQDQPKPDDSKDQGADGTQPEPKPAPQEQPGAAPKANDRESVDTVLDALEKHERNLPLERLRQRTRRKPDKDW